MGESVLTQVTAWASWLAIAVVNLLAPGGGPVASGVALQEPVPAVDADQPVGSETGYGPWRFGMTLEEVAAIEAHSPYEPVRASMGGLETYSGNLGAGIEKISFVFNSAGQLYLIRLWYELGDSYEETLAAFHRSYVHLTDGFGKARADTGYPLDPGMSAEEFTSLVPDRFAPTGDEFDLDAGDAPTQFQMDVRQLRLQPVTQPAGLRILAVFMKLHPTTAYLVNVLYQSTVYSD